MGSVDVLIHNQFGNYVIQHILRHGEPSEKENVIRQVREKLLKYSCHKYASNVVEKALQHSSLGVRKGLIQLMLASGDDGRVPLQEMMKDGFANYVVQKVIEIAGPGQIEKVIEEIRSNVAELRKFPYGKHIISRMEARRAELA